MLTALILTPLAGALLLTTMNENSTQAITRIKQMALLVTVLVFAMAMLLWVQFDSTCSQMQFTTDLQAVLPLQNFFSANANFANFANAANFTPL